MMTVLMTETLMGQIEKVKGLNLCTVMIMKETTMKKKSQVCADERSMVLINKYTRQRS